MGKHTRHGMDLQPLEGGGSGGGSSFAQKAGKAAEIAGITALGGYAVGLPGVVAYKAEKLQKEREEAAKAKRENTAEMKRESRGKEDSMTPGQKQSMEEAKDEEMRKKMKNAPTTRTEMGKVFAKGGMTASRRADGIAQRGKTRGTLIK